MRKDNELLKYINIANALEKKSHAKQCFSVSVLSMITGAFSGAITAGIMILIFK